MELPNKYVAYQRIVDVIHSCIHPVHFVVARRMVQNYRQMFDTISNSNIELEYFELYCKLDAAKDTFYNTKQKLEV